MGHERADPDLLPLSTTSAASTPRCAATTAPRSTTTRTAGRRHRRGHADRDAAHARTADLAAQLATRQAQIESLRRQLLGGHRVVTADNVDERVKRMLQQATAEVTKMRADARALAEEARSAAEDDAARIRADAQTEAERFTGAADQRLQDAEATYRSRVAEAESSPPPGRGPRWRRPPNRSGPSSNN